MDVDMYDKFCEKRFNTLEEGQAKMIKILQGNGSEGLCDQARKLERWIKAFAACLIFILTAITIQVFIWGRMHIQEDGTRNRMIEMMEKIEETQRANAPSASSEPANHVAYDG